MKDKIDDFGAIFRFLTPLLIGIIGWITIQYLSEIKTNFMNINGKFDVFLESYHAMDKRVDKLEFTVYGTSNKKGE